MSKLQTTIPFTHRKKFARSSTKYTEKENANVENNCLTPKKTYTTKGSDFCNSPIKDSNGQQLLKRSSTEAVTGDCSPPKLVSPSKINLNKETQISDAIKALHSSAPSTLPGREDKINELFSIFEDCLENKTSATLYVSGPPGTGKTACINHIIQLPKISKGFKTVYINCTGIKSPGAVYKKVADELCLKVKGKTEKSYLNGILSHLQTTRKMILLILDEIDQLESKKQSILYSIFEWPLLPESNIVLVGIANALDLTDRVLPRLKAKINLQPIVIPFAPYSKQQIIEILTERLSEVGLETVLTGGALQLLASKLAAISGDIRRALDLARRVVELAKNKEENGKTVSLQEVLSVVNNVYCTTTSLCFASNGIDNEPFPIQQKLLICTALLVRQKSKLKDLTVGKLHDVYKRICNKRNFSSLGLSEFLSLGQLVECRGVIKIQGKIQNRLSKVIMLWDESEVATALKDKELLASILEDSSSL